jgi:hypothetical protein
MSQYPEATAPGGAPPSRRQRVSVALALGLLWGGYCHWNLHVRDWAAADFTPTWRAAQAIMLGKDPYAVVRGHGYPFGLEWYYPLPAAAVALPTVLFRPEIAGALFFGASVTLAAYLATRESFTRLWLFAGPSCYFAASSAQWSVFVLAAALAPGLAQGWLVVKPTVGLAGFVYRPTWHGALGASALLAAGLLVQADWPLRWYAVAGHSQFARTAIATLPLGPVLLLAALRWRRPEGRLLLAMSCVPHTLFWHDDLLLWLAVRTRREAMWLTVVSWAGYVIWHAVEFSRAPEINLRLWTGEPWLVAFLYVPALLMVLRRPNEGEAPAWVDRIARRLGVALRRAGVPLPGHAPNRSAALRETDRA